VRIAVTGAAGFVGAAVCRAALAAGHDVHPLTREDWDIATGPLPDPPAVDAVVHCAAEVTDWGPAAPVWRANLDGTGHVARTFATARLVHLSTASVYNPYAPTVFATEDQAPMARYLTPYAASKAAAERLLATRPDTVILRPHAVYGPGDRTLLPRILDAIRGDTLLIVGDGGTRHSLTSVGNLANAALLAAHPDAPPGTYNIADAEPVAVETALRRLLDERGRRVRIRHLPRRALWPLAGVSEWAYRVLRRPRAPRLTRYAISHLAMERTLDLTAARTRLGFDPAPTSFAGASAW
jgi:nucleoside-diphosphate-sugar epimerase